MLARVEKPYTREQWKTLSLTEKRQAISDLSKSYISKYNEVKQPYLLRYARKLQYKAQWLSLVDSGCSPSRRLRHFEKGDLNEYVNDIAQDANNLIDAITKLCVKSREHGYAFNPFCVDVRQLLWLYTLQQIPSTSNESENPDAEDNVQSPEDIIY